MSAEEKLTNCLVAIGCNQGICKKNIREAIEQTDSLDDTRVVAVSSLLETSPVGAFQGTFLNGAFLVETGLPPDLLMDKLLAIERSGGRDRQDQSGNRPVDLDILLFGERILSTPYLTVPHPRMSFRRFVLEPAVEIAGEMIHPVLNTPLSRLLLRIERERNVVAVQLPNNFDRDGLELHPQDDVTWIFPSQPSDLLASLRRTVTTNDGWLVVLADDSRMLSHLRGAIKLLVSVGDHAPESISRHIHENHQGPLWELPVQSAARLRSSLLTAIDSMRPLRETGKRPV